MGEKVKQDRWQERRKVAAIFLGTGALFVGGILGLKTTIGEQTRPIMGVPEDTACGYDSAKPAPLLPGNLAPILNECIDNFDTAYDKDGKPVEIDHYDKIRPECRRKESGDITGTLINIIGEEQPDVTLYAGFVGYAGYKGLALCPLPEQSPVD